MHWRRTHSAARPRADALLRADEDAATNGNCLLFDEHDGARQVVLCALFLCAVRFAMCALRCALCAVRFALCALRFTLCALRLALCASRFAPRALRFAQRSTHFALCALSAEHCALRRWSFLHVKRKAAIGLERRGTDPVKAKAGALRFRFVFICRAFMRANNASTTDEAIED